MTRNTYRFAWAVAVISMVAMACTCGLVSGLGQAQQTVQTAQALATEVATSGIIETVQAEASPVATSGAVETVEAVSTPSFGEAPDDVPVMPDKKENFFGSKEIGRAHV